MVSQAIPTPMRIKARRHLRALMVCMEGKQAKLTDEFLRRTFCRPFGPSASWGDAAATTLACSRDPRPLCCLCLRSELGGRRDLEHGNLKGAFSLCKQAAAG